MTTVLNTATVLNTDQLVEINRRSVRDKRNRTLSSKFLKQLDDDGVHLVAFSMVHNDKEIRARILCKVKGTMEPVEVYLDMEFGMFNMLAKVSVPETVA